MHIVTEPFSGDDDDGVQRVQGEEIVVDPFLWSLVSTVLNNEYDDIRLSEVFALFSEWNFLASARFVVTEDFFIPWDRISFVFRTLGKDLSYIEASYDREGKFFAFGSLNDLFSKLFHCAEAYIEYMKDDAHAVGSNDAIFLHRARMYHAFMRKVNRTIDVNELADALAESL